MTNESIDKDAWRELLVQCVYTERKKILANASVVLIEESLGAELMEWVDKIIDNVASEINETAMNWDTYCRTNGNVVGNKILKDIE